jgi:uncharacterized protein (TIGR03437 family)
MLNSSSVFGALADLLTFSPSAGEASLLRHPGRSVCRWPGARQGKLVFFFLALIALAGPISAASALTLNFTFYSNIADVNVSLTGNEFLGTASGGTPPYKSFTLSASAPPGMVLSQSGASGANVATVGTPSSVADYSFTITVTDSAGATFTSSTLNLDVLSDVQIKTTSPLPSGMYGSPYTTTFQATGGYPSSGYGGSYTWSSSGSLPPGLSLNSSTGVLSGTPTSTSGVPVVFSVSVTDSVGIFCGCGSSASKSFTITISPPPTTSVTIQTNPPGLQFSVDGTPYTAPQMLNLSSGSHTIAVATTEAGAAGTQYVFSSWSDGGAASHSITVGASAATYTASFTTQYQLTISASTPAGGTVTPASGGFYTSGAVEPITATPNSGYIFTSWSGSVANATSTSTTVTMSAPETVTANFSAVPAGVTIQTSPEGLRFSVDGASYTAPQTLSLSQGSHTIAVATPQAGAAGTQYVFSSWSDGGAASHSITVSGSATYTASFMTQYLLTLSASPAAGGTVTATPGPSSGGLYNAGTEVSISAAPNSGYSFTGWSGDLAGSANPAALDMLGPHSVTANFTKNASLTITTSSIPAGLNGVVYQATALGVTGGTQPYSWASSSALPGSMSFSTGGVLSGTPSGTGSFALAVTVTDSSAMPLSASQTFTLNVTQPGTLLSISPQQLSFSYVQGDTNMPPAQNIGLLSTPSGTSVTASSITSDGGTWLTASAIAGGKTPGTIAVSVNTSGLRPNVYSGQVNISAPNATPSSATVSVTFTVTAAQSPQMSLTSSQSFALPQGGGPVQGAVGVSNAGGGVLNYTSVASSDLNWLTITGGSQGNVTPSTPSSIAFSVSSNAPPGLHLGQIKVTDVGGTSNPNPQVSNVALLVSIPQAIMQLSESGLTFYAVQGSVVTPPPQSLAIYNLWGDTLSWTTQIQYLLSNQNWLTVTPSGSSSAVTPGEATVSVNQAGLPKGQYYATVNVPSGAFNSPQSLTVLLNVVGPGELGSSPQASPTGTILVAAAGSTAAASQAIGLYSPEGASTAYTYSTNVSTSAGGNWLSVTPPTGSLSGGTASLTIQASAAAVAAGVDYGTVQVAFNDGTIQTIQVVLVATPGPGANPALSPSTSAHPDTSCAQSSLVGAISAPGVQPTVGVASPFSVTITDNCGTTIPPVPANSTATVQLVFSDGEPAVSLGFDSNVNAWTGHWIPSPSAPLSPATIDVSVYADLARTAGAFVATQETPPPGALIQVQVLPEATTGAPVPEAAINGASFDTNITNLVVPGGFVSIYGQFMADNTAEATGLPSLPPTLGNARLLLISNGQTQPLPLLFVNTRQVNGLIPQNLNLNDNIQLQVQRDNTLAVPLSVKVTELQPGIFTINNQGTGQGCILIYPTATVAGPASVAGQSPVSPGQFIEIYATGLGAVTGTHGELPPADGQPAPASGSPLYQTKATATVTFGSVSVPAVAALAPGFVSLYQVNVQVPSNAPTGSTVPVVLTMTDGSGNSVSSPAVTIAVQ